MLYNQNDNLNIKLLLENAKEFINEDNPEYMNNFTLSSEELDEDENIN